MNTVKWLKENTASLVGKTVAITGSTGGLGQEICRYILKLGGSLVLIDRNPEKSLRFEKKLKQEFNRLNRKLRKLLQITTEKNYKKDLPNSPAA